MVVADAHARDVVGSFVAWSVCVVQLRAVAHVLLFSVRTQAELDLRSCLGCWLADVLPVHVCVLLVGGIRRVLRASQPAHHQVPVQPCSLNASQVQQARGGVDSVYAEKLCSQVCESVPSVQMSPYASIAFHPLDGIMQASPYVIMLFVVPMHFLTSLVMLFFTGIWAMNIHVSSKPSPDHRILSLLSLPVMCRTMSTRTRTSLWAPSSTRLTTCTTCATTVSSSRFATGFLAPSECHPRVTAAQNPHSGIRCLFLLLFCVALQFVAFLPFVPPSFPPIIHSPRPIAVFCGHKRLRSTCTRTLLRAEHVTP